MALRLSDLPEHVRLMYEKQLAAEQGLQPVKQWHVEVTVGAVNGGKVFKSKPYTDEMEVRRAVAKYIKAFGSRNICVVESFKEN